MVQEREKEFEGKQTNHLRRGRPACLPQIMIMENQIMINNIQTNDKQHWGQTHRSAPTRKKTEI